MKILCIGDQHFKDNLSYADYITDRRVSEKKRILDYIIQQSVDCQHIVFLGDNFNSRNNSSETNREFVEFLERFEDKQVYLLSGNHEKKGNGKTAIDFIGEIKKDNWHIFTKLQARKGATKIGDLNISFLPYMHNSELGSYSIKDSVKKIMTNLDGGDILFAHHTITGSSWNGIKADSLTTEIVLPREELEKKYRLIVAGHIHESQQIGNTLVAGSIFTSEVGEVEKYIYKIETATLETETIPLPGRSIYKFENPTIEQLKNIDNYSIIKAIVTDKKINIDELEKELSNFDAHIIVEDYPSERKKIKIEQSAFDFSIEALLKLYSKEKDVNYEKLINALEIINNE